MTNRRSGLVPGRRLVLGCVLVASVFGAAGNLASADSTATVAVAVATVYHNGGGTTQDTVTLGDLQGDPHDCPQYASTSMAQYDASGPASPAELPKSGPEQGTWSLASIFRCMQSPVSVGAATRVGVLDSNGLAELGSGSQVAASDLTAPSDFNTSSENPVISMDGPTTFTYDRPWRGGSDANGPDAVTDSAPIALQVFDGPPLTVAINVSPSTAATGAPITFSATVTGDQGSALTYDWSFGDGLGTTSAANPTESFPDAGTWDASLQVIDANGGEGGAVMPITITASAPGTTSTPTGPASPTGATHGSGSNPQGGGNPTGQGTTGTQPTGQHPGATPTTKHHPGATRVTPVSARSQPKSRRQPPRSARLPASPSAGPATGSTGAAGTPSSGSAPAQTASQPRPATHRRHAARAAPARHPSSASSRHSRVVTGLLISDVIPLPAGASPLVHLTSSASAAPAPRVTPPRATSPWTAAAVVAAILALLGLGAARELGLTAIPGRPVGLRRRRLGI